MKKMKMQSIDMTENNIEKIATLFPNCITESADENGKLKKAINFDMLKQMLSNDITDGNESYEFTWVGKKAAIVEANKPISKTLRPCKEESVDWDNTENLYIEGDNLEVLKLLQESYLGKIKMIYIDPPYNTGNDFIYNDDFKMNSDEYSEETGTFDDEGNRMFKNTDSNGRFHSDWCSMIYPRLMLAKNLLSNEGFIAISIGEEELNNLMNICNEVLGESNFRNIIEVRRYDKNLNLQFAENGLSTMNVGLEYILVYSKKNTSKMKAIFRESSEDRASSGYWKGFWNNADRPTMRYPLFDFTPTEGQWKWQQAVADEAVENYKVYEQQYSDKMTLEEYWTKTGKNKRFLRRNPKGTGKNMGVEHWVAPADGILRNSNWSDMLVSKPVGMGILFDSPKNVDVLKELIKLFGVEENDIVLDFFSGSASTADAVINMNLEDEKKRKFIMVQLPEEIEQKHDAYKAGFRSICDIGKERIRRTGKKICDENPILASNIDTGFRVFKVDESNMTNVYYSPEELDQQMLLGMEENIKPDRTELDLLFGCLIDWGIPLNLPYTSETIENCTVHNYNDGDLIACFDKEVPESVIKEIARRQPLRVVFRDSCFADSPSKINVGEIFKMIAPDTRVKVI